jgi:hypothetical protein
MVSFNFDRTLVLVMFSQANPGNTAPSESDLTGFDHELVNDNEPSLTNIMRQNGLPLDTLSKSKVLAYKPNMPGNTPELQIANACTFFLNTEQALSATVAPAAMAGSKKKAAPRKRS